MKSVFILASLVATILLTGCGSDSQGAFNTSSVEEESVSTETGAISTQTGAISTVVIPDSVAFSASLPPIPAFPSE